MGTVCSGFPPPRSPSKGTPLLQQFTLRDNGVPQKVRKLLSKIFFLFFHFFLDKGKIVCIIV